MKSTILLCTYNGEAYLQEQLDSFLRQTLLPDHIYIADDGSTDATMAILTEFEAKAPMKVTLVQNQTRLGYAQNFLTHFIQTDGDLVFFADQDDIWWPNKIEEFEKVYSFDPFLALIFSNAEVIDDQGKVVNRDYFNYLAMMEKWDNVDPNLIKYFIKNPTFINGCFMAVSGKVRKKVTEFFDAYPNYREDIGHDQFISMFVALSFPNDFVREILRLLVRYRVHDQQIIGSEITKEKEEIRDRIKAKRLEKESHLTFHQQHLQRLLGLATLIQKNHEQKSKIEEAILFNQKRIELVNSSRFMKSLFVGSHFITGQYHRFCQFPMKELIRDFL